MGVEEGGEERRVVGEVGWWWGGGEKGGGRREEGSGSWWRPDGLVVADLGKLFPTTGLGLRVSSAVIATVSLARSDGATNYTSCSNKLSQLGHTFLCECLASMFLTHVPHETTICMSGERVRVRAALSTL